MVKNYIIILTLSDFSHKSAYSICINIQIPPQNKMIALLYHMISEASYFLHLQHKESIVILGVCLNKSMLFTLQDFWK